MSADERILRLENALATLAELSADHGRRVVRLEEAFVTLVELARNHNDGMDELRAAQANSEQKIAALADAHIRMEDVVSSARARAEAASAEADRKIAALAAAHARTEEALARLTEKVDAMIDRRNGRGDQGAT